MKHGLEWQTEDVANKVEGSTFLVQTGDLQMLRAPCSRKTNGTQHAYTWYVQTCFDTYDTLIGTYLVCCFVQEGLRCALLCSRFNDIHARTYYCGTAVSCYMLVHTTAVLLFLAAYVPLQDVCCSPKTDGKCRFLYKMLEDMHDMLALANSVCLLALSSGIYEIEAL